MPSFPGDVQARQAVAVAASVIPPDQATTDVIRISGEYSYGNGFDSNIVLELSPNGRFIYRQYNCERVVDEATGKYRLQDGLVYLIPERPHDQWPRGTDYVLMPVPWGQRLYLVPQNDFRGFSNQVNRGVEPITRGNMGSYLLREGDWDRPATGKPHLPDEWKSRLLERPVTGRVAGRDPSNRWIISLGQEHGVYDGMELSAWAPDLRQFVTIIVTDTGSHTSAIKIEDKHQQTAIQGWTVYSRVTPPDEDEEEQPRVQREKSK